MELNLNLNPRTKEPEFDKNSLWDLIVVGGGPAGLNAALYAKRKGNKVGLIAGQLGGQVINTSVVENYLGYDSLAGEELVNQFVNHVKALEVPMLKWTMVEDIVIEVNSDGYNVHTLKLHDRTEVKTKAVILATGSQSRKLQVPGEDRLAGRGVAYCAICDAPLYKGKDVLLAGGGNAAVEAAIDLSKVASSVTIIHRSQFRADKILMDQMATKANITVHLETQILEIVGDEVVEGVLVKNKKTDEISQINGDGIFIEIGHIPNTDAFKDVVELNHHSEVIVNEKQQTNVDGIYAIGDMTTTPYKQIVIAVAEGAKAALAANEYVNAYTKDSSVTDNTSLFTEDADLSVFAL